MKLIQQVSEKLHDLEWGPLDLTLRQFVLPPEWNGGDKRDYCVEHTEQADDSKLLELYEHLYGGTKFALAPRADGTHLWEDGYFLQGSRDPVA